MAVRNSVKWETGRNKILATDMKGKLFPKHTYKWHYTEEYDKLK